MVTDFGLQPGYFSLLIRPVLDFLNSGATRKAAMAAIRQYRWADSSYLREQDVTSDGVPELLFSEDFGFFVIYTCVDGQYELHSLVDAKINPRIFSIKDLNLNRVPEIITIAGDGIGNQVDIFEWDGSSFQQLNMFTGDPQSCGGTLGYAHIETVDMDGNGTHEVILRQDKPKWGDIADGIPWRVETRTCTWNGAQFVITRIEYGSPEYRFQAVQDGDQALLKGEYDLALDRYQQAIFDDRLDWWSPERRMYERQLILERNYFLGTTIPETTPVPDPSEYGYLASYSRYRIMLLHILRGYLPEAKTVYVTLQEKFPAEQVGHEFAEMARLFWDEYQVSADVELACSKAIEYAAANAGILTYLGSSYHGWQSHTYKPEDVCPLSDYADG